MFVDCVAAEMLNFHNPHLVSVFYLKAISKSGKMFVPCWNYFKKGIGIAIMLSGEEVAVGSVFPAGALPDARDLGRRDGSLKVLHSSV